MGCGMELNKREHRAVIPATGEPALGDLELSLSICNHALGASNCHSMDIS